MKKIYILGVAFLLAFSVGAALFEKEVDDTLPTYTLTQLNQMFGDLETYYGNCSEIFLQEGKAIELCECALTFSRAVEVRAVNKVVNNPSIDESTWRDELFATYLDNFDSSRWQGMFNTLTQNQFNVLLDKILYWNPLPYDDTRTFAEFKAGVS